MLTKTPLVKLSGNRLKMGDGSIRHFSSAEKRDKFEHYVNAIKHGWKPTGKGEKSK